MSFGKFLSVTCLGMSFIVFRFSRKYYFFTMAFLWGSGIRKKWWYNFDSIFTRNQIFRYKNHAYGIQFHIEVKKTTVAEWGCVPEYKSALENQLGKGALEKFDNASQSHMASMNEYSKILYENFKRLVQ